MNAHRTSAMIVTGAMNIKRIMKYEFVIDVMDFIVVIVMRWISAMIVMRLYVHPAPHCYPVNFVAGVCVKIAPLLADGTLHILLTNNIVFVECSVLRVIHFILSCMFQNSCGIVLCSRDSKFAVECDTCRLSYCLVCLASGSKDACVRCGSRPSKRMEQLVHLRLKSIYKAFKQNSSPSSYHMNGKYNPSNPSSSRGGSGGRHHPQRLNDELDFGGPDDPDVLFQAVKISEAAASSMYANTHKNTGNNNNSDKPSSSNRATLSVADRANRFKEEKEKADAAAAALLAELDEEEEENVKSKSKKKKKKKSKQQQPFPNNDSSDTPNNNNNGEGNNPSRNGAYVDDDDDDGSSLEYISNLVLAKGEYVDSKPAAKSHHDKRGVGNNLEQDEDEVTEGADQLENDLCNLVAAEDVEGLEKLMESIKGIPGRAALRKNAKKALKKLLQASTPDQVTDANASLHIPNITASSHVPQQAARTAVRVLTPDIPSAPSDPNGYLQVISHVHNKPASQCATPGSQHVNSAQSRSRSNSLANANGPLKSECMMHVRPLIVGWMIGKGGQRIRDLMEESGARIWIDQDSMGPNEPRILYISGARKNVDIAIGLLQSLVLKYQPLPSPHTRQPTTPHSEKIIATSAGAGKGPSIPEASDMPSLPLKQKIGPSATGSVAVTARQPSDGRSKQILSCDPRFVPLLIGRRGWTIKNIQDSTGAKVDIDQTSTPRKITISGLEENVDRAVRMVQDVLSYPHSQLHGVIENSEHGIDSDFILSDEIIPVDERNSDIVQVSSPLQSEPNIPTQSIEIASDIPTPLSISAAATKVPGNSPPSSLIMTGDAKSTISASSSLSSTPEPVLLSGSHAQVPPIDLNQTNFPLQQSRDLFTSSGGLQQGTFNHTTPQSPQPHPSMFQSQNGNSFFGSLDQNYQHLQPDNQLHALNAPMPLHPQINRPSFLPDQSSAFFSVHGQTQMPSQHPLGPPPTQNLFGMGHLQSHGNLNETVRQSDPTISAVGTGFWNGIGAPQPNPSHVGVSATSNDGFKLHAAAVDFLEHSQQVHNNPIPSVGGINDVLGLSMPSPVGLEQTLNSTQDPLLHFPKGRDDAQMVDSLFGPTTSAVVPSSVSADNLLSSLNGLSLCVDESSPGLWGSTELLVNSGNFRAGEDSTLFDGLLPQKSESRFVWEDTGQF
jgi:KH domain